ncbi:MAG TPA: M48 family metalloprotease [Gaiellaceae bacterium]|nr:M48 family metalloprotease [Gaiellaceae bacterium]
MISGMEGLAAELFGTEQVEKARRYHRPGYLAWAANTAVGLGVLALLAVVGPGFDSWPWWMSAAAIAALALAVPWAARMPIGYLLGFRRERNWGFSTQTPRAWLADRLKALAVTLALTAPLMVGLVGLGRWLPEWWPLVAAGAAAVVVLLVAFVAPVVIEPVFNRFRPLEDETLAGELRDLAERAGAPVRDVLVADASRRTTKVNAYVSGVGRTRRVVLFDTLLERASPPEVKLVVAHELGHRKRRHVLQGTILAMAGAALAVLAVWAIVGAPEPGDIPEVLLIGALLELAALPLGAALSRRWEREADRFALDLTGDRDVFEQTFRELAIANLSDLDPPRALYYALFSHPTVPERIAFARRRVGTS